MNQYHFSNLIKVGILVLQYTIITFQSIGYGFIPNNNSYTLKYTTLPQPPTSVLHQSLSSSSEMSVSSKIPLWYQHSITITAPQRGCHLITNQIMNAIRDDITHIHIGLCHIFVQHTSASLSINENADPDVRIDMETALNKIVPASWTRDGTFRHIDEGDDDMPGHVKSSLLGVSLSIPIQHGKLALGTWQGIYLNEHRDQGGWGNGHQRNIIITLQGQSK